MWPPPSRAMYRILASYLSILVVPPLAGLGFFWRGCVRLFCGCFTDAGDESEDVFLLKRFKTDQKGYPKRPAWSQKGAKVSQGTFKNTTCGTRSTKWRKRENEWSIQFCDRESFLYKIYKQTIEISFNESIAWKHQDWCQMGAKIVLKLSQNRCRNSEKTMPKKVPTKKKEPHQKSCFSERAKTWFWA